MNEHVVPEGTAPERLDRYALTVFAGLATVTHAYKAAKRGELMVDGAPCRPDHRVRPGERITFVGPARPPPPTWEMALEVAWEDDQLALVVKPAGIAVSGNQHRTLEHALRGHLAPSAAPDALSWPRPVHRLDFRTSGLVIIAKTATARAALGRALQEREVHKRYRALLVGRLEGEGQVDLPLDDRPCLSRWRAVAHTHSLRTEWLTTADLWPVTGRTHQLRRHTLHLGHPVLGDDRYGIEGSVLRGQGLFLQAQQICLAHPTTGAPLDVAIPELPKFEAHRAREARRWEKWRDAGAPS
ncbi:MAG: RluA family pseudouridine synthase [Pseudomonadota bacterium]